MILGDFLKALGQIGDRRFLDVLGLGLGLTVLLLAALATAVFWSLGLVLPDVITLPWIGEVAWVSSALSWAGLGLTLALSPFLMVPVAGAFTGLFLDRIADAVEDRHYPGLPPTPRLPLSDAALEALGFFGLVILANLAALVLYLLIPPLAPVIFWAVNGFLLGREFFQMAAMRHLGRAGARTLWRRNLPQVWLAGGLMAVPLTIPVVNLLVPILAAATFTHLYHRLTRQRAAP